MMEVLVAIGVLGIVALSTSYSTIVAYKIMKRNRRNAIAHQLCLEKMEQLAAVSPALLSDADDLTETPVTVDNVNYIRQTDVTVNSDNSRTVTVSVTPEVSGRAKGITLTNSFPLWGRY
jgi:type II secretory pathway pseudopilin PulG